VQSEVRDAACGSDLRWATTVSSRDARSLAGAAARRRHRATLKRIINPITFDSTGRSQRSWPYRGSRRRSGVAAWHGDGRHGRGCDVLPEVVERDAVKNRVGADDLAVAQVQEPGARIRLGLAVLGCCGAVEVGDDGVTVGVEVAHRLCEPAGESGVAHRLGHTPTRPGI
jgi:hypothetical protein